MTGIHHFAYGWINPTIAYVMSVLGSLLGLVLAARSRESAGGARARWLTLAGTAVGGTGIWLMRFMAMLGFDVPASVVRYSVPLTITSLPIAIGSATLGLYLVGFGRRRVARVAVGGLLTGLGLAVTHYTAMAGLNVGGQVTYDHDLAVLALLLAIAASMGTLWFATVVNSAVATVGAALLCGAGFCGTHYVAMAAVRVRLDSAGLADSAGGVSPFGMLVPVSVLACVVITALAYATVGLTNRRRDPVGSQPGLPGTRV